MNNDDLKRFMKKEINLDIKNCLGDIKESEVDIEPCLTNTKHARNARKYAFYSLIALTIITASSYQAYRYITPQTYITIEVGHVKNDLSAEPIEGKSLDSLFIKCSLNDFNHVIDVTTPDINVKNVLKMSHMKYQEAFPIIVDKLLEYTNKEKELTITIYSDDKEEYSSIEKFLTTATFNENYSQKVFINDYDFDDSSDLSYGTRIAIEEILKHSDKYTKEQLEGKSLSKLLDILLSL